ncbi:PEP-CTERM sorting domain-containing protein [Methylophilus methylotrophus]|uniref:PEP-CTERM sorting domain-containing protein n=1 Tax=Methylophilus methylotrophus TaxID=17 RepID=UPI000F5A209A|nr:PEP-CTERM sorting domain-containing protein [Methylophilus methylotrophus]
MQLIKYLVMFLALTFAGNGVALADYRYNIVAVDDVNGDPTFSGSMTTSAPFSLNYNFNVLDFVFNNPLDNVSYRSSDSSISIDKQGFTFAANNGTSTFILTLYPENSYFSDTSYFSEFTALGQSTVNNSGYVSFIQQTAAVPEPSTNALLLAGLAVFVLVARRQQKAG